MIVATIVYAPFDLGFIVRRAIEHFKPAAYVVMETELWPNVIMQMHEAAVPVAILNGRISAKSFKGYAHLRPLLMTMPNNIVSVIPITTSG